MKGLMIFIWPVLFSVSCSMFPQAETPIVTPYVDHNFYQVSIETLSERLEKRPNDKTLVNSLLFFYKELGWPEGSSYAFERATSAGIMDQQILLYQMDFYFNRGYHSELDNLILKLSETESLPFEALFIKAKFAWQKGDTVLAKESMLESRQLQQSAQQVFESSRFFLSISDTSEAVRDAKRAFEQLDRDLVFRRYFAELMYATNQSEYISKLLPLLPDENEDTRFAIAKTYWDKQKPDSAIWILQNSAKRGYQITLAKWYKETEKIDSARKVYDDLLSVYPEDTIILLARAKMEESVGYFSKAINFLDQVLKLDSVNSHALNQKDIVQRKVAYLQKIRAEQKAESLPTLEFKKINK